MNICVVGWYWNDDFLAILNEAREKHIIVIIAHREPPGPCLTPYIAIPNIGLEFGCYDYYLKKVWSGGDTLFVHDDTVVPCPEIFDRIAEVEYDCAYIFRDRFEEEANGGKHGRAIFCSDKFLKYLKANGGFWYDKDNNGFSGAKGQARPNRPDGSPINFNIGIHTFHRMLGKIRDKKIGLDVVNKVYFQQFECGRRGTWRHRDREWQRYGKFRNA